MKTQSGKIIYTYSQASNKAIKAGIKLSEMFTNINVPGWVKSGWVKK